MTRVCGDLVGGIVRKLRQQTEWRMELLDESRKPVFRFRLLAETLDHSAVSEIGEPRDVGAKIPRSNNPSNP